MFKKKKAAQPRDNDKKKELAGMLGGLGMDPSEMQFGMGLDEDDDDDDDASLEAELAALQGGHSKPRKKKPRQMGMADIDRMAADSLRDDDDDEDDDAVLDDTDLLAELQCIAPDDNVMPRDPTPVLSPSKSQASSFPQMGELTERETMYQQAKDNAEKSGNSSKAKRLGRGLKQIEDMIKQAKAGKTVYLDDLPPPVATGSGPPPDSGAAPPTASPSPAPPQPAPRAAPRPAPRPAPVVQPKEENRQKDNEKTLETLKHRQNQYKMAALTCKRAGDIPHAKEFLLVSKQIETMVHSAAEGKSVDLSQLPPEPSLTSATAAPHPVSEPRQQSASPPPPQPQPSTSSAPEQQSKDTGPPPPPKDVAEALQQRLDKYNEAANKAKEEGNSSKARRMGRIIKQYEDAVKSHKAGRPVDYEELPTPPGFAPIPVPGQGGGGGASGASEPASQPPPQSGAQAPKLTVQIPKASPQAPQQAPARQPSGRNEQQLNFLTERQKEFKMAALNAKKEGDIDGARNWLRMSKGLDPMIENASNGLRVDLSSVPPSPSSNKGPAPTAGDYTIIGMSECVPNPKTPEEVTELFSRLEDALIKQVEMCVRNGKHYQKLGDINNAKMYEKMARSLQQDLDAVKSARKHKDPPPRFHYEDKSFTIVNSFPDLSDSEVEITVVRCLNIPLPSGYQAKDMYCYVTYDFPYPSSEEPQIGKSQTVKHSINPEYNEVFKANIDRKNRALTRIFRRQAIKFEVKYERGFLKGDKTLGQVQIKLAPFDSKSELHECVDLMDPDRGRRAVGGKVEVILRLREPLTDKDVNIEKWKWLVIDMHLCSRKGPELSVDSLSAGSSPKSGRTVSQGSEMDELVSVEVLKMEKQLADRQLSAQRSKGGSPSTTLLQRSKQCQLKMDKLQSMLAKASKGELQDYVRQVAGQIASEQTKAQRAVQAGNKTEAQLCLTRKKLMQNELVALKPKLGLK